MYRIEIYTLFYYISIACKYEKYIAHIRYTAQMHIFHTLTLINNENQLAHHNCKYSRTKGEKIEQNLPLSNKIK